MEESRLYTSWKEDADVCHIDEVGHKHGIIAAKRALNVLHQTLGAKGYTQVNDLMIIKLMNNNSNNKILYSAKTLTRTFTCDASQKYKIYKKLKYTQNVVQFQQFYENRSDFSLPYTDVIYKALYTLSVCGKKIHGRLGRDSNPRLPAY